MSATGLFRWLTLLALLFAPLAMIGGGPAMAHHQLVAAGHCADSILLTPATARTQSGDRP